jgi:hypothetical protein
LYDLIPSPHAMLALAALPAPARFAAACGAFLPLDPD